MRWYFFSRTLTGGTQLNKEDRDLFEGVISKNSEIAKEITPCIDQEINIRTDLEPYKLPLVEMDWRALFAEEYESEIENQLKERNPNDNLELLLRELCSIQKEIISSGGAQFYSSLTYSLLDHLYDSKNNMVYLMERFPLIY